MNSPGKFPCAYRIIKLVFLQMNITSYKLPHCTIPNKSAFKSVHGKRIQMILSLGVWGTFIVTLFLPECHFHSPTFINVFSCEVSLFPSFEFHLEPVFVLNISFSPQSP